MILKVTFLCDTCKKDWIDVVGVFNYYWEVFDAAHQEGWYIDSENGKAECYSCVRTRQASDLHRARQIVAECGMPDHGSFSIPANAVEFSVRTRDASAEELVKMMFDNTSFFCSFCGAEGAFHWIGMPTLNPKHPTMLCDDCHTKWKADVKRMCEGGDE
jgi:hypothetical protein